MNGGRSKFAITYNAPVTLTFALLSLVVLIIGYFTKGASTSLLFSVYRSQFSIFYFIRLFGHVMGHADLNHFASNMTLFLLLGPVLEEKYGQLKMVGMFAIVALISGIVNVIFFPSVVLLGASGLVFMMIVLVSATDMRKGEVPLTMILVMVIYLGSEIRDMVWAHDNVSQLTHIIGGLCGAVFGGLFGNRRV